RKTMRHAAKKGPFSTAVSDHTDITVDIVFGAMLLVIAVSVYGTLFLHVPVLTETRDFVLRFGNNANLRDIWIPSGDDYRPFSWKLFAWQRDFFGLRAELFNLVQFVLLGLCALAGYFHLRQLLISSGAAFLACMVWLLSLPVAHAAFWQATQHDKLACLF